MIETVVNSSEVIVIVDIVLVKIDADSISIWDVVGIFFVIFNCRSPPFINLDFKKI